MGINGTRLFTVLYGGKVLKVGRVQTPTLAMLAELARISGVPERTILDIMAGVKEPELGVMCKIAEGLGICVHELRADEESYAVSVSKDILAKLIVVSEINGVELEELINCILEKGIEEHGFYA